MRHTLYRAARLLARPVRVGGRRYGRAGRHVTSYVGAATRCDMASVCAGAHIGVCYRVLWPPVLPQSRWLSIAVLPASLSRTPLLAPLAVIIGDSQPIGLRFV